MSAEDLERYETEIELQLYQEYRAVLAMFKYVVETERRFYLANEVKHGSQGGRGPDLLRDHARDAWVWDMYRPARFVSSVRVVTFKDVNVEELPEKELVAIRGLGGRPALGRGPRARRARIGRRPGTEERGYEVLDRNWRCRDGELDLVVPLGTECSSSAR